MARLADHSEFTIGDYIYFVRSSSKGTVSPRPVDTTKESYADLVSPITYNGETYIITDLDGWKKSETGSDSYTGYGSFKGCTNLVTPPTLPSSVTSMRKTFFECTSLKTAPDIPSGVTDMMECFYHCSALETGPEVIPSGVTNVIRLFCGCTLLQNAPALPENAKSLTATFGDCESLTHPPVIPASVTNMWSTFDGCINLEEAPELPAGLTVIKFAFNNCKKITTAPVIPAGITDMSAVFQGCESLQLPPEIPDGVTTLYYTFRGCTSLQNAPVLPNNIESLACTFTFCESLKLPPVIPNGVTDLDSTFAGCTSLSKAPSIPNGVTNMRFTFNDCPITETPLIPENVENMLATFQGCTLITTMSNIPSKVTALKQTFMGCTSLVNFTEIPSTVTSLHYTFRECAFENPPVIPDDVTNMRGTFYKCTSLTTAPEIPNSVTDMTSCFNGCSSLEGIVIVRCIPSAVDNIFEKTSKQIFIIDMSTDGKTAWKSICSAYQNIHYQLDDVPDPTITISVNRVANDGDITPYDRGRYVFVDIAITYYKAPIPSETRVQALTPELYIDGELSSQTFIKYIYEDGTVVKVNNRLWYENEDFSVQHTYNANQDVSYGIDNIMTQYFSARSATVVLAKLYALINAFHDDETGTEGIAFGTLSTKANSMLIALDAYFNQEILISINNASTDPTDDDYKLYHALVNKGWI